MSYADNRDPILIDARSHGGKLWRIEPRLGYASCRLFDDEALVMVGTLKQVFRHLSRETPHLLGARNFQ